MSCRSTLSEAAYPTLSENDRRIRAGLAPLPMPCVCPKTKDGFAELIPRPDAWSPDPDSWEVRCACGTRHRYEMRPCARPARPVLTGDEVWANLQWFAAMGMDLDEAYQAHESNYETP